MAVTGLSISRSLGCLGRRVRVGGALGDVRRTGQLQGTTKPRQAPRSRDRLESPAMYGEVKASPEPGAID